MTGDGLLHLRLRRQIRDQDHEGNERWRTQTAREERAADRTALLICDVWDRHWCRSATRRCDILARKMAPIVDAARARGVKIIHAPSDCMDFYAGTPQRRRLAEAPPAEPPSFIARREPPLPIDDRDGGCDDVPQCETYRAWTRQHPAITIADEDGISDDGAEVYRYLRRHDRNTLLVMGVHTNMCVLGRSFGIRQMTHWGISCLLLRDLTDSMYNPRRHPFVTHAAGTRLVVTHIERYWCPSILSADLRS